MQVNRKIQLSCRKLLTTRISGDNIHLRCETSKLREAVPEEKKDYILGIAEGMAVMKRLEKEKFADEAEQKAG